MKDGSVGKVFKFQKSLKGKGSFNIYPGKVAAVCYHTGGLPQRVDKVPSFPEKGPPTEQWVGGEIWGDSELWPEDGWGEGSICKGLGLSPPPTQPSQQHTRCCIGSMRSSCPHGSLRRQPGRRLTEAQCEHLAVVVCTAWMAREHSG